MTGQFKHLGKYFSAGKKGSPEQIIEYWEKYQNLIEKEFRVYHELKVARKRFGGVNNIHKFENYEK